MTECTCVVKNREKGESMREWFKRIFCMHHWMQTDYYQRKLDIHRRAWIPEPHLMEPVHLVFTDTELFEQRSKGQAGQWFLYLMKEFITQRQRRPREWVLMDNEDYQQLVQLADYKTTERI